MDLGIEAIRDKEILKSYNSDALGFSGNPEGLFRPSNRDEVIEIVKWANREKKCITPVALRSSTTGSCVAEKGFLISSEKFEKILDLDIKKKIVSVEPGVNLGELKRILEKEGVFFPPDPTSENECTVGGCVSTNASGARTLKYGPFRNWVKGLKIVLPTGVEIYLERKITEKNCAGYFGFQNPMDFFIGSEGTLGFVTQIDLSLTDLPQDFYSMFIPFKTEKDAINFCYNVREKNLDVRCLEYFDRNCVNFLKSNRDDFDINGDFIIFMEFEFDGEREEDLLNFWFSFFEENGVSVDDILVAESCSKKEKLKEFRHFIPATINEISQKYVFSGGGKISTDWAVFLKDLEDTILFFRNILKDSGFSDENIFCFGHVGNGHPHFNILTKNATEKMDGIEAVEKISKYVCKIGGTITAEHGIGKVKKRFLKYYYDPIVFSWMKNFKRELDPNLIFSPGNIFDSEVFYG